jgi:hypothetical protein
MLWFGDEDSRNGGESSMGDQGSKSRIPQVSWMHGFRAAILVMESSEGGNRPGDGPPTLPGQNLEALFPACVMANSTVLR